VGAGPGHPQLLTIKARELIRRADIIIYDRLIQTETLNGARADAEQIYVGKAPGLHQSRQDEIHRVLLDSAQRAQTVVRLKGGDPVLFGRGGEEAEYLASNGIPFEVVPGVTAGLSVPMAAGIPVTHRDHASSVVLVTGHRRDDREMREIDWSALSRLDTLVFFMGVAKLPQIAERLMAHGRPPTTPAAVVQMAYWPGEQVVVGTLEDLPRLAKEANVKPPATIVVGEVVKVRERLTTHHRDLRRDSDEPVGFGLSAEGLLQNIGGTLRGAKDLLAALELELFDELEQPVTAAELAGRLDLSAKPLAALLAHLAAQGLVLRDKDTFRNSEAASLYLNTASESWLGKELMELLSRAASYDPLELLKRRGEK
jgi:uroporphyrin-III C-methyltransferase